jgi:MinD-like ATPase involved in chromosome partitioning or flagellar assembly
MSLEAPIQLTPAPAEETFLSVVALVSELADENVLYNTYPANGTGPVRLMSRVRALYELEKEAHRYRANVVLIDSALVDDVRALAQVIHNLRHHPEYPIITVGLCRDAQWLETFRKLGALIVITSPVSPLELQKLNGELPLAFMKATQERALPTYHAYYAPEQLQIIHSGAYQSHTISVWSSKGGVGKSFIAREIAVAFGVVSNLRTLLIDADMNCGDQHTYLSLPVDRNLYGLAGAYHSQGELTPAMVEDYLVRYDGNLFVLNGLYSMALTGHDVLRGRKGEQFAKALFDILPQLGFTYVVYDLGQNYHDGLHLVALQNCSLNLVIATSEKSTANEMVHAVRDLREAVHASEVRFRLVLNKWDDRLGIDARDLVERIGLPEFGRIPYGHDLKVDLSLNQSKPMVLDKPNEVSNAIIAMVSGIYRPIETYWDRRGGAKRKRGLFGRR